MNATDSKPAKRTRPDWDAVQRDYRTDTLTLRELAAKHGVTHTTISRRAEREGWQKDLTEAVRQATNSRLIAEAVQERCNTAHQNATDTVLAAAEVNTRVVMAHRKRLGELHELVELAKAKLEQAGEMLVDVREAATFVQAAGNLAAATTRLIDAERKAFGLDDEVKKGADTIEELLMAIANEG